MNLLAYLRAPADPMAENIARRWRMWTEVGRRIEVEAGPLTAQAVVRLAASQEASGVQSYLNSAMPAVRAALEEADRHPLSVAPQRTECREAIATLQEAQRMLLGTFDNDPWSPLRHATRLLTAWARRGQD